MEIKKVWKEDISPFLQKVLMEVVNFSITCYELWEDCMLCGLFNDDSDDGCDDSYRGDND